MPIPAAASWHGINLPYTITPEVQFYYNPELLSVFMFVPGLITIILMLISAMMTSISITREKEMGTMEILMASPLKPIHIIIGKVIPYLLLSFLIANIILLLGRFVFMVPVTGSILLLELMVTLFIITTLSLGIMTSTITDKMQTAMMISMIGLMMPTILLSGFIFPVQNMPLPLQWVSNAIPANIQPFDFFKVKFLSITPNGYNSNIQEDFRVGFFLDIK